MGTRGYYAWRFRKRYYTRHNNNDSYPSCLGAYLARKIPKNRKEYVQWLEAERQKSAGSEAKWERCLIIRPKAEGNAGDAEEEEDGEEERSRYYSGDECDPNPSYLAPLNGTFIEWVYIFDLDREVFSVNNSIHFKLDQVPYINWKDVKIWTVNAPILASLVPEDALVSLVATPSHMAWADTPGEQVCIGQCTHLHGLTFVKPATPNCRIVTPKGIRDIPWHLRHGPGLRWILFSMWSDNEWENSMSGVLGANLLQWSTADFPFREVAFAILCIVSGGRNMAVVRADQYAHDRRGRDYGLLSTTDDSSVEPEFVSHLATEAHFEDKSPGVAPDEIVYWYEGVLVVLATQPYRPYAVDEGMAFIARYCELYFSADTVDAILFSIEHVVLVRKAPGEVIQRTALLPLFNGLGHISMDVRDPYSGPWLADCRSSHMRRVERRNALYERRIEKREKGLPIDRDDSESEQEDVGPWLRNPIQQPAQGGAVGNSRSTFFALTHVFDAAARRRQPLGKTNRLASLPPEIFDDIFSYLNDPETRSSCMSVSKTFRDYCQEHVLFAENMFLEPCEAWKSAGSPLDPERKWALREAANTTSLATLLFKSALSRTYKRLKEPAWSLTIGAGKNRKVILPSVKFKLDRGAK
ncbi:MAG: hypothetical protein LQ348_007459 [Seirophora lacunosa]|nr:MAG: hypothetical protein LQ348_007459 [Seirophora lacunosa]